MAGTTDGVPPRAAYLRFTGTYRVENAARHVRRIVAEADAFIAANTHREPGALLQDRRTGAFFLPRSDIDWAHTREHRGHWAVWFPTLRTHP